MNIYVGNLDFKVNESELSGIFEEYGTVSSSKIVTDKFSGRSRGFGFITMDNAVEANRAISELNGMKFSNRELVVNEALEKKQF
ncbi:MAG: RNA-binding protein [Bacteroidales bacterium]|nr:RNA-binding protein [Bacteroidales bacterium]